MPEQRDWKGMWETAGRQLNEHTGEDVAAWNRRIHEHGFPDEQSLRGWLTQQGVTGYAQTLLVMERFGYPDYFQASANELIDAQYASQPELRPVFDAIIQATSAFGEVAIQARKTYVSLVTPRRTFARIQPGRSRVEVGLRLVGQNAGGRLEPSRIHASMPLQVSFSALDDLDAEALGWLKLANEQNA